MVNDIDLLGVVPDITRELLPWYLMKQGILVAYGGPDSATILTEEEDN